jgi:drug/metabolite transporter (DMT)-like permease
VAGAADPVVGKGLPTYKGLPTCMNRDNRRGIVLMLLAVALLSVMDAGLKALAPHYPPLQVGALRGAASWPLIAAWIFLRTDPRALLRVRWGLHLLRGALGVMMLACFVYGLRGLPLTTAYTFFFVAPLLITLLSKPLLGERIGAHRWIAIVGGFAGVLVALRPGFEGAISWATLAVLAAAAGYALSAITVRLLGRTDSTASMVFWLLTMMAVGSGLLAAPGWVAIQPGHWWLIAGIGVVGALGQFAITEAFARGEASVIAPLEYTALLWGPLLDLLVWRELPGASIWVGAAAIVACGIYLVRGERLVAAAERARVPP